MSQAIGVCSICGGTVEVYSHSIDPIVHCKSCGARKNMVGGGTVIDMVNRTPTNTAAPLPNNSISLPVGYPFNQNPVVPVIEKRSQFKLKRADDKK